MAATAKIDALETLVSALDEIGARWGVSLELRAHNLTRAEFDSFDGDETHFPPTDERTNPFWSKRVTVYKGAVDLDRTPMVEGGVTFQLFTDEPPVIEREAARWAASRTAVA